MVVEAGNRESQGDVLKERSHFQVGMLSFADLLWRGCLLQTWCIGLKGMHRFVVIDLNSHFLAEETSSDNIQREASTMAFR